MKYLDEYSYGIYPYIPEHMEEESLPVFENAGKEPPSQTGYGNSKNLSFQDDYDQISGVLPSQQNIYDTGTPEQLPPDAYDFPESEGTPGYRRLREHPPSRQEAKGRYMRMDARNAESVMPADPYPYNYPQNMNMALDLIREALAGESEDTQFYSQLLHAAPVQDREIISGIRNDEMKHFEFFRKLFYEHTGRTLESPAPYGKGIRMTYCEGLKKALLGEVKAVGKYRQILFAMQDRRDINILTEILTDEIRHADLYNLLFNLNACPMGQNPSYR